MTWWEIGTDHLVAVTVEPHLQGFKGKIQEEIVETWIRHGWHRLSAKISEDYNRERVAMSRALSRASWLAREHLDGTDTSDRITHQQTEEE